jgi:hypothetical protein
MEPLVPGALAQGIAGMSYLFGERAITAKTAGQ